MVSSGIGSGIGPVRLPETSGIVNGNKNPMVAFGELMAQTMSAGIDSNEDTVMTVQTGGQMPVSNTSADAAERIPKQEETKEMPKAEVKEKVASEDKVTKAEDAIREEIKEKFGVTDEDIDKALEVLGLTMADLLDKSNLMDFVMQLEGVENTVDMLVMGDLSAKVDEVFEFVTDTFVQLADEYGVNVEQMADIFAELTTENVLDSGENDVQPEEVNDAEKPVTNEVAAQSEAVAQVETNEEATVETKEMPKEQKADYSEQNGAKTVGDVATKIEVVDNKGSFEASEQSFESKPGNEGNMQGVVNNLAEAITEAFTVNDQAQPIDAIQIINQIVETAKLTLNQEVTSMEMMLNPESLGKINLNISVREGVVTATIVAQNEAVKEAIESQIILLKDNMNNQGLKVEAVEVTVEPHAFETNAQQGENNAFNNEQEETKKKTNRQLRLDSLDDLQLEELSDEEKIVLDMMAQDGNRINFKA